MSLAAESVTADGRSPLTHLCICGHSILLAGSDSGHPFHCLGGGKLRSRIALAREKSRHCPSKSDSSCHEFVPSPGSYHSAGRNSSIHTRCANSRVSRVVTPFRHVSATSETMQPFVLLASPPHQIGVDALQKVVDLRPSPPNGISGSHWWRTRQYADRRTARAGQPVRSSDVSSAPGLDASTDVSKPPHHQTVQQRLDEL